jgi:hypothetical protein
MPAPLTVKRPKVAPPVTQVVIGVLGIVPLAWLIYLWQTGRELHFENRWINLCAHAALIVVPLVWAVLVGSLRPEFERTDEQSLGESSFFDKLPMDWWTVFMMWPCPIFAIWNLGHAFFSQYLPHPEALSMSALSALAIVAMTFGFGLFYASMVASPVRRVLVSTAGLRTGLIRFFEWHAIHHFSKRGDLYSIYHKVNQSLPAVSFRVRQMHDQSILERYFSEHQIPVSGETKAGYTLARVAVIAGFAANLALCFWLRFRSTIPGSWISLGSFCLGVCLTLVLERFRGVSRYGKCTPKFGDTEAEISV